MKIVLAIALSIAAVMTPSSGSAAEILWVDRAAGDDSYAGDDIGSADHPYASIQAAVNAASDGDTVKVLPGDYDNGGYVYEGHTNRVFISKRIHLVSTGGAAVTTIRGKYDTGDTANNGENRAGDGVRCVRINNKVSDKTLGYGAVVEGFTLRDGYAHDGCGSGGAVRANEVTAGMLMGAGAYIVDCVITNCSGTLVSSAGSAVVRGGTLVRCAVHDSTAWSTVVGGLAWNCVFSGNSGIRGVFGNAYAVNCSLSGNENFEYLSFNACTLLNTVTEDRKVHHTASCENPSTVYGRTGVFADAGNDDWRLLFGSAATGIADAAMLTNMVDFTEAAAPIAFTDFAGNALPSNGVINAGAVQTVKPPNTWWVDRYKGDDSYTGDDIGSAGHPYASIQAAVDAASDGDTVKVLPGDYDNGGYVDSSGHFNRVNIAKRIRLVSTGGAAVTTIRGKFDTGDTANNGENLAGDGVRCVRVETAFTYNKREYFDVSGFGSVIEGFTLRDGYAAKSHSYGGALLVTKQTDGVYLVRSVVTNCTGTLEISSDNGVVVRGTLVNCAVYDSSAWGIVTFCSVWNSVFMGNTTPRRCVAGYSTLVNCSMCDNDCQYILYSSDSHVAKVYSTVSQGTPASIVNPSPIESDVAYTGASSAFVDAANGDWRLRPGAVGIGEADAAHLTEVINLNATFFPLPFTDFAGNPLPSSGPVNAGAVQTVAPYVYVEEPRFGGWSVSGCTPGVTNFIPAGSASLAVTVVPDSSSVLRPLVGLVTNGVLVSAADIGEDGITVTVPAESGAGLDLTFLYSTNWYVNAETGSDSNNGFTPDTAFATLAAACTNEILVAGDVIHVAEGVYSNGVVAAVGADYTVGARAYVKSGVTLVADGARENTVIEGAGAPEEYTEDTLYGTASGKYAVRGVLLEDNATVRGFTIRGGRTRGYEGAGSTVNREFCGGGVAALAHDEQLHANRLVECCVITNNAAAWGGGAYGVKLRRCTVEDNTTTRLGGNIAYSSAESCFIGVKKGGSYGIYNIYAMLNTTVSGANDGVYINGMLSVFTNSVILVKVPISGETTNAVRCIFRSFGSGKFLTSDCMRPDTTSVFVDDHEAAGLDGSFRPTKGSLAVDFCGDAGICSSGFDLAGVQRVMNGVVDCGCFEYDWRGDYAAIIGARRLEVVSVSPAVAESDGKVRLCDGCEIVLRLSGGSAARRTLAVAISGAGSLAAYVNGVETATLTSSAEGFSWESAAGTDEIRLVFSGDGYADLGKLRSFAGMAIVVH